MTTLADLTERERAALDAIQYLLHRTQSDPDLGYYLGPAVESWERLVRVEAELTGRPFEEVRQSRATDLQPAYARRKPDVVRLKKKLERLEETIERLEMEARHDLY